MATKKPQARRVRSKRRRITPRRWLPFVALVAIAADAFVVERSLTDEAAPSNVVNLASTRLPVATESAALSTAWYCSGGTAMGEDGKAELSVVIANAAAAPTTADVTVVDDDGGEESTTIGVPAYGRTRVTASEVLKAEWVGMTVEVLGGEIAVEREVVGPNGYDVSPCSSHAATEWFVPSGSTVIGAEEYLLLYNPFPAATSVDITFATDEGALAPRPLQGLTVAGRSVRLVPTDSLPARRAEISTHVQVRSGRLVVDRLQIYDGSGDAMGSDGDDAVTSPPPRGLASSSAIPQASLTWVFPQGRNDQEVRNQVALYNPGTNTAEVDVIVTFEDPARMPEVEPVAVTIPPGEQRLVDLTDVVGIENGLDYTIGLVSFGIDGAPAQPVVAELLTFNWLRELSPQPPPDGEAGGEQPPSDDVDELPPDDGDSTGDGAPPEELAGVEFVPGFSVVPGAPVAASEWILPSRGGTPTRGANVVVANPSLTTVEVTVEAVVGGRRQAVEGATVKIPPRDRRSLNLTTIGPSAALVISADGAVVVQATSVSTAGLGSSGALASPLPDAVMVLPPLR
ncbi:MAG: DUF5719 family protein [Aquihabitans sp.]